MISPCLWADFCIAQNGESTSHFPCLSTGCGLHITNQGLGLDVVLNPCESLTVTKIMQIRNVKEAPSGFKTDLI